MSQWWLLDDESDVRGKMMKRLRDMRANSQARRGTFERLADFYGTSLKYQAIPTQQRDRSGRLTFNYAKAYLDTYVSQLCKSKVLPMISTTGGDWQKQRCARGLNQFFSAVFDRMGVYDVDPQWTRDAALFGTGILYCYEEFGQPAIRRVLPTEIDFDEFEWRHGSGKSWYWSVPMDRGVLKEMYPRYEKEISATRAHDTEDNDVMVGGSERHDLVLVRYAWHLPSKEGADDGRWGAFLPEATLSWEPYEHTDLPFIFMHRSRPIAGLFGDSLMQELISGQMELEFITDRMQTCMLLAPNMLFLKRGAKINQQKIGNLEFSILEVDNPSADVVQFQPAPFPPAMQSYMEMIITKMAAVSTVSPMAAMGEKPTGITAASALELMDDQESERKIVPMRCREAAFVQLARLVKRICEKLPRYQVNARDGGSVVNIKLSDVTIDDEELVYSVLPTNQMAKTAAGRMQQAQDLMKLGVVTPERVSRMLGFDDIETETMLMNAQRDNLTRRIEKILYDGEYEPPNPMLNYELAVKLCADHYANAEQNGAPEENLELLRKFVGELMRQKEMANAPPAPGPAGAPPPNGAPPNGAPPQTIAGVAPMAPMAPPQG